MDTPAFPDIQRLQLCKQTNLSDELREKVYVESRGMTLRDYFAAKAMQAYINAHPGGSPDHRDAPDWVPSVAYEMADAMLKARKS